jgi:hypothetical protein
MQFLQLPDVPFRIFGAKEKDQFRKPMPGIWYELERVFREDGVEIGALSLNFDCALLLTRCSLQTKRHRSSLEMQQVVWLIYLLAAKPTMPPAISNLLTMSGFNFQLPRYAMSHYKSMFYGFPFWFRNTFSENIIRRIPAKVSTFPSSINVRVHALSAHLSPINII